MDNVLLLAFGAFVAYKMGVFGAAKSALLPQSAVPQGGDVSGVGASIPGGVTVTPVPADIAAETSLAGTIAAMGGGQSLANDDWNTPAGETPAMDRGSFTFDCENSGYGCSGGGNSFG